MPSQLTFSFRMSPLTFTTEFISFTTFWCFFSFFFWVFLLFLWSIFFLLLFSMRIFLPIQWFYLQLSDPFSELWLVIDWELDFDVSRWTTDPTFPLLPFIFSPSQREIIHSNALVQLAFSPNDLFDGFCSELEFEAHSLLEDFISFSWGFLYLC